MDDTLDQLWSTIDATQYKSPKTGVNELWKKLIFSTEVAIPFQSSQDLATQAANQLTHAFMHPQPAGPFVQVGDDQMLILERLSAIFEGAIPSHESNTMPPPQSKSMTVIHLRGCK
jgi:hypothetical protein